MKIGVIDGIDGADGAPDEARLQRLSHAEAQGYAAVWVDVRPDLPASAGRSLFAAAQIAENTHSVRVGLRSPLPGDLHPLRLAEDLAVLDIMSGGRLDWAPTGPLASEFLEIVLLAWRGEPFAHEGERYAFPELRCLPVPEQPPHPGLWFGPAQEPPSAAAPERTGEILALEPGSTAPAGASADAGKPRALIYPISAQGGAAPRDWLAGLAAWRIHFDPEWVLIWPEAGSGDEALIAETQSLFAEQALSLSA
jgi:alkanesulfonate monooxygenase SsuD/methylene tetrahydromethanopterin reductase-like flavin-dependent oxidoreductase (luciferase family)